MAEIRSLQAGRGFAALAVVLHHANLASRDFAGWSVDIFDYGWLGVDFFFVLSGFIIAWSAPGKSPSVFAWHRVRRVLLPYLPIGIGLALLYTFLPGVSDGVRGWSWCATLTLAPINANPALSVAWTLQHEVLFYLIFFVFYFTGRLYVGLAVWALLISTATIVHVNWLGLRPINFEFILGVAACEAVRRGRGNAGWLFAAVVPLVLWIALGAQRDLSPLVGVSFAVAVVPMVKYERQGRVVVPIILTFLGGASYSLYLAHGLAISITARIAPALPFTIAAGVLGGLAYYFAIEWPVLRFTPRSWGSHVRSSTSDGQ